MKKTSLILITIIFTSYTFSQSVEIKDSSDETLMIINDEGAGKSSITIPISPSAPTSATNKLYNEGGTLKWSGNALGTAGSAGGWTDDGTVVRLSNIIDNVGIGTTNPLSKLSVGGDGTDIATIYGVNTTSEGRGVYGGAFGQYGMGVYGSAIGSSGRGVYGEATGSLGRGVYGYASNAGSSQHYGGYFEAEGSTGRGVYGEASGSSGRGVYGYASKTGFLVNYGGYFQADGSDGRGVFGIATGTSGRGVYGHASGSNGQGVRGYGVAYDFYAAGTGTDYGSSSSIRWKKNIVEIDNPLEKLSEIRGVYFNWDEEHGGQHDVGCIAEEVGKVLPEIVVYEENGIDADGMDYSKLTPLLIEVAKTQQKLIEDLTKRIEYLESN